MKRVQHIYSFLVVAIILLLPSCDRLVDSYGDEVLRIKTENSVVHLSNESEETVYFVLLELEISALVDLDPDYKKWPSIEAGSGLSIPYEKIIGYRDTSEKAIIMWVSEFNGSGNSQTFEL